MFPFTSTVSRSLRSARSLRRLQVASFDALESRRLFSTFTVTSVADSGAGSLRDAIDQANAHANAGGPDLIDFGIQTNGVQTIKPLTPLPKITEAVTIDGFTQQGATPNTQAVGNDAQYRIVLDGDNAGKADGLEVEQGASTIRGLVINDFQGAMITVDTGGAGSVIEGNFIGADVTGADSDGGDSGVVIRSSTGNLIGGFTPAARNLMIGSKADGVLLIGGGNNTVVGNYIGVNAQGTIARPNGSSGVGIIDSINNTIGSFTPGAGNVISGNIEDGITVESEKARSLNNTFQGNFIGTDATGHSRLPNHKAGIRMTDSPDNLIGGSLVGAGNLISGNDGDGIVIFGDDSIHNLIAGNFIGTDITGNVSLFNDGNGILLDSSNNNVIGGRTAAFRNVISGNDEAGVSITGIDSQSSPNDNRIEGNYIGTNAAGTAAVPNDIGIEIARRGFFNVIGGTAPGAGNVISGNHFDGIRFFDNVTDNEISGNRIGTNDAGTLAIPNGEDGISFFQGADDNIVGGLTPAARNIISGNLLAGIFVFSNSGNVIQGNYIGTDVTGANPLSNAEGIEIDGASNTLVGGSTIEAGNIIAFNGDPAFNDFNAGVDIFEDFLSPTLNNAVRLNSIFGNVGLGIDLGANGTTANDAGDFDDGANHLQNTPVLATAVVIPGGGALVTGVMAGQPNASFLIDFYSNAALEPLGAEGQHYLGTIAVSTDANGKAAFSTTLLEDVQAGQFITATATTVDESPAGNTSEFSPAVKVSGPVLPPAPPASPPPTLSVTDASISEGNSGTKTLTFTVKLNKPGAKDVFVDYSTVDGTAKTGDSDYVGKSGLLTFTPGQTSKTVSVTIKGDKKIEANETFKLNIGGVFNATTVDGQGIGTITNDDTIALPKLSVSGFSASEGKSGTKSFTFKVTLDKADSQPVTVNFATADGTAKAGADYVAKSGVLTFAAGETVKTVTIVVKGDEVKEVTEEFFLKLSSPVSASIAVGSGKGTIVNDD